MCINTCLDVWIRYAIADSLQRQPQPRSYSASLLRALSSHVASCL